MLVITSMMLIFTNDVLDPPKLPILPYFHNRVSEIRDNMKTIATYCPIDEVFHIAGKYNIADRCCNNCPRDNSPRRQLSKGLLSNDTVVQGDYCPMRLLSKEAFTSEKLAQINFSYFLLEVITLIDYRK